MHYQYEKTYLIHSVFVHHLSHPYSRRPNNNALTSDTSRSHTLGTVRRSSRHRTWSGLCRRTHRPSPSAQSQKFSMRTSSSSVASPPSSPSFGACRSHRSDVHQPSAERRSTRRSHRLCTPVCERTGHAQRRIEAASRTVRSSVGSRVPAKFMAG